jgi:hypothetical protein
MVISRRNFLRGSGLAALGLGLSATAGSRLRWVGAKPAYAAEQSQLMHVLNRTTWGIRPQDIVKIGDLGIEGWVDYQLNYEQIPDPVIDELVGEEPALREDYQTVYRLAQKDYGAVYGAMLHGRLYRAAFSERQLFELMVEFWTDHFNVPIPDVLSEKTIEDREVIRKHALGRFRDMLFASAQSPAMLIYLDNTSSEKEHPNENYAREVMELHTLGVDGGYTEQDVRALARILTGWKLEWGVGFTFDMDIHDTDEKTFLGVTFPSGRGIEEGMQALDMLATHPNTARHVCRKLIRRFVSDVPPQSLIDSAAEVFTATTGDIRQVMRHILLSGEFKAAQWQKFRRPMDFWVAVIRAMYPAVRFEHDAIWTLEALGQIPFHWHPPNGYPDAAGAWMNTNGLLHRWNVAMAFPLAAYGWWDQVKFNPDKLIPKVDTVGQLVDVATQRVLAANINPADREQLISAVTSDGSTNADEPLSKDLRDDRLPLLLGLLMSSPYFQWR